jgi:hypothetical protein
MITSLGRLILEYIRLLTSEDSQSMFILYSLNPRKQIFFNYARCFGVEVCVKFAGMKLVTKATTFCFIELALILKNFDSLEGSYGSSKWFMLKVQHVKINVLAASTSIRRVGGAPA